MIVIRTILLSLFAVAGLAAPSQDASNTIAQVSHEAGICPYGWYLCHDNSGYAGISFVLDLYISDNFYVDSCCPYG
jgi:hypothetical protein